MPVTLNNEFLRVRTVVVLVVEILQLLQVGVEKVSSCFAPRKGYACLVKLPIRLTSS
jgi:hypothetical protein